MANKKISELDSRALLSLSDLLAVGDPTTGYLYKITITDLKSLTGAGVVSFNGRVGAVSPAEGDYTLNQLADAIITSPSNGQVLKYNGSNWVNAAEAAETDTLNSVTTRGNTTTNGITVGSIVAGTTAAQAYHAFYSSNVNDGNTVTIAAENVSANSSRSQLLLTDTSGGASKRFGLGVYTGASPYSYLDASTKLVFQQSGGNVIVGGITDAGYKFDVVGTARIQGNLTLTDNANLITSNQFYGLTTNYTNGIFVGWDASAVYLGYKMGALPIHLGTDNTGEIRFRNTGGFKVDSFAGTGSRILVTDANGVITASTSALSGFVPYTGATANVGLGSYTITAGSFIRTGGTSSQFLKADGSVDSSTYLTTSAAASTYLPLTGGTLSGNLSIVKSSGSSVFVLDSGTNSINELNFKINGTSKGLIYVNESFYQFNNYSTYGYLFKNAAGTNIFALQDAGSAFFSSSVGATLFSAPTIQVSNASTYSNIVSAATAIRTITLPDASGTVALTSQIPSLSGYVTGSGSTNTIAKFTGTNAIGNSMLSDDGTTLTSAGATRSNLYIRAASNSYYGQLAFTNGTNGASGGISYNNSGQYMQFETNTSEWMRLTSDGKLGINTTSPNARLHVAADGAYSSNWDAAQFWVTGTDTAKRLQLGYDTTNGYGIIQAIHGGVSVKSLLLNPQGGNVAIGTTSPSETFEVKHSSNSGSTKKYVFKGYDSTGNMNGIALRVYDTAGGVSFADIGADYFGTGSSTNLTFSTRLGGGALTEQMRINNGGDLLLGTTTGYWSDVNRHVFEMNATSNVLLGFKIGNSPAGYIYHGGSYMYINNNITTGARTYVTTGSAGVYLDNGATSWSSASDERLKNIDSEIVNAIDSIMTLRAIKYSWKNDKSNKINLGLIAQDVEKVFPQVIDKGKLPSSPGEEQIDETEYLGVRYSELVPVLIKAIQELKAEINTLKNN